MLLVGCIWAMQMVPVDSLLKPHILEPSEYEPTLRPILELAKTDVDSALRLVQDTFQSFVDAAVPRRAVFGRNKSTFKVYISPIAMDELVLDLHGRAKTAKMLLDKFRTETDSHRRARHLTLVCYQSAVTIFIILDRTMRLNLNEDEKTLKTDLDGLFDSLLVGVCVKDLVQLSVLMVKLSKTSLRKFLAISPQITAVMQACILHCYSNVLTTIEFIRQNDVHDGPCEITPYDFLYDNHYRHFAGFLTKMKKRSSSKDGSNLSFPLLVRILDGTELSAYHELDQFQLPTCPYFCKFLMESEHITQNLPLIGPWVKHAMEAKSLASMEALDELISQEAEEAARLAFVKAKPAKRVDKKRGPRGNKPSPAPKPVKSREAPETETANTEVSATLAVASEPDRRELDYATLFVGEYLLEQYLRPVIKILGYADGDRWSWDDIVDGIESELDGTLAAKRNFLVKAVEWVKKRNLVAHPKGPVSGCQLMADLRQAKRLLPGPTSEILQKILKTTCNVVEGGREKALDGFGRKDLGITSDKIQLTISILRLTQHLIDKTVGPLYEAVNITVSVPALKSAAVATPFGQEELEALIALLECRNALAHPKLLAQVVRVLIAGSLFLDHDYPTFLTCLARQ